MSEKLKQAMNVLVPDHLRNEPILLSYVDAVFDTERKKGDKSYQQTIKVLIQMIIELKKKPKNVLKYVKEYDNRFGKEAFTKDQKNFSKKKINELYKEFHDFI